MAASTRAITPTHTDPFLPTSAAPRTPTSITSGLNIVETAAGKEPGLLNRQIAGAPINKVATPSPRLQSKQHLSPKVSPQPLTGAAAQEEERRHLQEQARRSSPNPAQVALNTLLGAGGMSSAKDAPPPATTKLSEPLAKVAKSITIPEKSSADHANLETSPVSMSSFGSVDHTTAPTATAIDTITSGPLHAEPMAAGELTPAESSAHTPVQGQTQNKETPRSFTYPPPILGPDDPRSQQPARNMSLPTTGYHQGSPKSPSTKRHKCPYCSTDFTRHHNLKSHLLTHSQEKPYECQTCNSRFRRLHDLKRHTKLHTGERPHTCPKCGRKFARGDALARHNKGQGGCAGRRASFADDDSEIKGDAMEGLEYGDGADGERMDDGEGSVDGRRRSDPLHKSRDRQGSGAQPYHPHSSTYPPVGVGATGPRAMYPPQPSPGGSGTTATTGTTSSRDQSLGSLGPDRDRRMSGVQQYPHQQGILPPGSITESPKPLSPGQIDAQHRAGLPDGSSIGRQHHTQPYSRGSGSSGISLPPPGNAPQLPPIAPMTPDARMPIPRAQSSGRGPLQPSHGPGPSMLQQQVSAASPSTPASHPPSPAPRIEDLVDHIHQLESRFAAMQETYEGRIRGLEDELAMLRGQQQQPPHHATQPLPPPAPAQPALAAQPGAAAR